jgi:hypothetical protein
VPSRTGDIPPIWRYRLLHGWRLRWHLGLQPHRWLLAGRCHNFHTTVRSGGGGRSALCTQPSAALHLPSILAAAESSWPGDLEAAMAWQFPILQFIPLQAAIPPSCCLIVLQISSEMILVSGFLTFVWLLTWSHHFVYTMYTDTLPLWPVACGYPPLQKMPKCCHMNSQECIQGTSVQVVAFAFFLTWHTCCGLLDRDMLGLIPRNCCKSW